MASNGVFCLEGEWETDLRKQASVLPVLDLLERLGEIQAIHRNVATIPELRHYLDQWSRPRYKDFYVLYLATHGDKGRLQLSPGQETTLDALAEMLGPSAESCYIYFGSCLTLFNEREAQAFVTKTGAAAVLGYRADVEWLEGAAFEVILLASLASHYGRPATLFKRLMERHGQLASLYKFVMVTKKETLRSQDFSTSPTR